MKILTIAVLILLVGCGGGSDKTEATEATSDTQTTTTNCGDVSIDLAAVEEIVESAEEAGVDVIETEEPTNTGGLSQEVLKTGVIIAVCGSTVVTDDSVTDNDTVTTTSVTNKLLEAIANGEVSSLEVRR